MTFDAWEVGLRPSGDCLAHHGIRGMKHGRRRYQNEDGSWTEVGLAERRKREGFGERRAEKKAARAERKSARKEARRQAIQQFVEKRRQNSIKNLSDEELQARINRLNMEKEYKELAGNPVIKSGAKLVSMYLNYKNEKEKKAERLYNMQTNRINAQANLARAKADRAKAKADKRQANSDIIDNLTFGKDRKNAKTKLKEAKMKQQDRSILEAVRNSIVKNIRSDSEAKLYKNNPYFRAGKDMADKERQQKLDNTTLGIQVQMEKARAEREKYRRGSK